MEKNKQFKKNFIWNILGTGFNAFNSLFFMITVTRINGLDNAGIFTLAFSTACIIYVIGVYAGRIYQVTEPDKTITNKEYIINRIITTISMVVLVILFCLIKKYTLFKTTIFILLTTYKALEAFSDVIYGILQKEEKLEIAGKSLFLKSLFSIIAFILVDILTNSMLLSIIAINIVSLILLIFYDFRNVKQYINFKDKINNEHIKIIFKRGFYTFAITFLGNYVLNSPKYAIDNFLTENYQTIFGIIVMPATVMGLVAQFLIHPYLNEILAAYEENNLKKLNRITNKLVIYIIIFGIVASLLAYTIGTQVLGFIYGLDLSNYKVGLLIIIISATLYTIGIIYSSILTTVRETFSQFIIYIIVSVFAYIMSNICISKLKIDGAIISYLLIMALQFLLYTLYTNIKFKKVLTKDNE